MNDHTADIAIVGGGPAGLCLALLMLRSGAKVTLVERSRSFQRDYRGEILQPGGLAVLDQLGVLDRARQRGAHELSRFQLVEHGRTLLDIDYRRLPAPYNYLLSIPQRHLLEELLDACRRYDDFTYLDGTKITGLIQDGLAVTGLTADGVQGEHRVSARWVIGADGRYSKVRRLAGIDAGRLDIFDQDVLWFKLAHAGHLTGNVQVFRGGGRPVLVYDSFPDCLQLGWTLPHNGYRAIADQGIDRVRAALSRAVPQYASLIEAQVTSLADLTLLDVFSGCAPRWAMDGLVLIGDAAHTHSPIGAQGINLAIGDAVLLHPYLVRSLRTEDFSEEFLSAFYSERAADVRKIMKLQLMQSKGMLSQTAISGFLRPKIAGLITRTPLGEKLTRQIAFGSRPVNIRADLLAEPARSRS